MMSIQTSTLVLVMLQTSAAQQLACGQSVTGTTANANGNTVLPFCVTSGGHVSFSTCNSYAQFDTILTIYDGCNEAGFCSNQIARNDDASPSCGFDNGHPSTVFTSLSVGCYALLVDGYNSAQGNYAVDTACYGAEISPAGSPVASP